MIKNYETGLCLTVSGGPGSGPYGGRKLTMSTCYTGPSGIYANQIWTMITARTASGRTHFISFYNAYTGACLDGGNGVFGNAAPCSGEDNYQVWDVYY